MSKTRILENIVSTIIIIGYTLLFFYILILQEPQRKAMDRCMYQKLNNSVVFRKYEARYLCRKELRD